MPLERKEEKSEEVKAEEVQREELKPEPPAPPERVANTSAPPVPKPPQGPPANKPVEYLTDDELERLNHPGVSVEEKELLKKRLALMLEDGEEEYGDYWEYLEKKEPPIPFGDLALSTQVSWARSSRDENTQRARNAQMREVRNRPEPQAAAHRTVPIEERKPYPDHSAHEEGKSPAYHPGPETYEKK